MFLKKNIQSVLHQTAETNTAMLTDSLSDASSNLLQPAFFVNPQRKLFKKTMKRSGIAAGRLKKNQLLKTKLIFSILLWRFMLINKGLQALSDLFL